MSQELAAMLAKLQDAEQAEEEGAAGPDEEPVAEPAPGGFDEAALLGALGNLSEASAAEADPTILTAEELSGIESSEVRAKIYSSQVPETTIADPNQKVQVATARRPRAAGPAKPRIQRDLAALPAETFVLLTGDDPDRAKAEVLAHRPTQTKVVEKWENLFIALAAGAKPSKFVVTGFTLLKAKGTMTSSELVAAMKAEGLRDGTARAQTGQIMALFPLVAIGTRTGQTVTLRQDSVIAEKLTKILGL